MSDAASYITAEMLTKAGDAYWGLHDRMDSRSTHEEELRAALEAVAGDIAVAAQQVTWEDDGHWGRCPSVLAGHRCAFVRAHEHPHGAQIFGPDGADTYATWGLMASPQQPLPATRDGIAAAVRRECAAQVRSFADEKTGRYYHVDEEGHPDYLDHFASRESLLALADRLEASP